VYFFEPKSFPGAWVLLRKAVYNTDQLTGHDSTGVDFWHRDLVYHSTATTLGHYSITTMISSFRVEHFEVADTYNGWMAVGDIGGFVFWMVVLHTFAMIMVGLAFPNDSGFLQNKTSVQNTGGSVQNEQAQPLL